MSKEIILQTSKCRSPPHMPADNRLPSIIADIDSALGSGFAREHPELIAALLVSRSVDTAAQFVAAALVADSEQPLVPVRRGLMRGS
jgi:hypothetical protein